LNLIQGQVASGVTIERDSLTQLFTSRAQAALVQRYEAWKMLHDSDGEKDPDVFNLPTTEFITLMYELFPITGVFLLDYIIHQIYFHQFSQLLSLSEFMFHA
jgi:hypothetical protein